MTAPGAPPPGAGPGATTALAIGLLAVVIFALTLGFDLVWDDPLLLEWTRSCFREGGLSGVLGAPFRLKPEAPLSYYRPVVMLSLLVDDLAGGGAPPLFHLTNVLLHGAASVLVLLLLSALGAGRWPAAAGAALFAVHPVHVESVAFVSGRTDLLAAVFALAAALLWVRDRGGPPQRGLLRCGAGLAAYALACLSKEVAFLLPVVLAAWDLALPRPARDGWRRARLAWGFGAAAVMAGALVLRTAVAGEPLPLSGLAPEASPATGGRFASLPGVLLTALRLLVAPWPLNAYYTADQVALRGSGVLGVAGLVAAVALLAGWAVLSTPRFWRAGWLSAAWTVAFLLPGLGLVAHGGAAIAERFLYLPSVGVALLVLGLEGLAPRTRRAGIALAFAAALLVLPLTIARQGVWRSEEALFTSLIRSSPRCVEGYLGLAHSRSRAGRHDDAIGLLEQALALEPRSPRVLLKLGLEYGSSGRLEQAIASLRQAAALDPGYPEAHATLGLTYLLAGRAVEARAALQRAVELRPGYSAAWTMLGRAQLALGDPGAAGSFRRALELAPHDPEALRGLEQAGVR
ncbi:MAG: tetratricopeptide repeat protein [Acidobacteria bacterium]|jgi:tetratricopeptide (TPR) repeat protein|nr:tetratricopeptide repeat protein [Acidobacteriota bacterium]